MGRASVDNLDAWNAKIAAMPPAIRAAVQATLDQNAQEFADRLATNVPKESGDLATTIRVEGGGADLTKTISIGDAAHPYAAALEFGHMDHGHHVPPNPYFFPLLRVIRKRLSGRMSRAIKSAVRGYVADGSGE